MKAELTDDQVKYLHELAAGRREAWARIHPPAQPAPAVDWEAVALVRRMVEQADALARSVGEERMHEEPNSLLADARALLARPSSVEGGKEERASKYMVEILIDGAWRARGYCFAKAEAEKFAASFVRVRALTAPSQPASDEGGS